MKNLLKQYQGLLILKACLEEDTKNKEQNKRILENIEKQINQVNKYIEEQEPYIKEILKEKYINGKTWKETAYKVIGKKGKAETVRQAVTRHFKKYDK